ncbi:hypothetical protein GWI33_003882 [Rhynchophorus ferrugineus]|uniref:Protein-lysine N-methyltransferase SMYD4 n=1 Tax=Rhynchophorus ferrugineus TaxID=354439 RepID=A0A834IZ00_RHYFE|nr:hypothetical protein GWI33_003882 [Rhynchophorus ferrugineus]
MSEDFIEEALVKRLQAKNEILTVSLNFRQIISDSKKVDYVHDLLLENDMLPDLIIDRKCNEKSDYFRKMGNQKFVKKLPKEAVELYTQSIAHAENNSREISLAYANRSAVLFEYKLYKECIEDINQAISNNYPNDLKPKIELRKSKALELITYQFNIDYTKPLPSIPKGDQNPLIQSASKSVEIKYTPEEGRFVVASRDIKPGDLIANEKPLFSIITNEFHIHCHECLKICYNLIPCERCTQALYCSQNCKKEAYKKYHKYECAIMVTLRNNGMNKLDLIAMRIAILIRDDFNQSSLTAVEENSIYRSDRYTEIHNLVTNREKRTASDLFQKAATTAILYHYLKTNTNFFDETSNYEENFKELVLLHRQTSACNFHNINADLVVINENSTKQLGIDAMNYNCIASGAYSFLSMFNHSCSPNVLRLSCGINSIVIALEPIKKGEKCLDNYGYHYALMTKQERQHSLKDQYKFVCNCDACEHDYPCYQSLPQYGEESVSNEDFKIIMERDSEKIEKLYGRIIKALDKIRYPKPSKNLADLQEMLKACVFIGFKVPF